ARGEGRALDAAPPRGAREEIAEIESLLGVAIVADADAGDNHLRLAAGHALLHLLEHRGGRARAGTAANGGDDAVGALAVAAVLYLHESAGAGAGPLIRARGPGLGSEDVVLDVSAGAQRACHRLGDVVGGAAEGPHGRIDRRELAGAKVDGAAAHEHLARRLQRAAYRLPGLRLRL